MYHLVMKTNQKEERKRQHPDDEAIRIGVQDIESIFLNSRTWRGYMDKLEYLDPVS